ncbi:hypothetical protein ONS95_007466 [Cadophora gregata]|uniref:uncharacterized protein n=1 Tax=Cadophora gregata TaxID=51156 RepID=UPI0026DC7C24|nr:uncharacterized protein ONS95_007466 [Cadophora gregata]KAK0118580.1 hypothetical protein ONS96_011672 [Cadophora gregata f. sp. sojae]KAK0125835.1 hypothetical protein ONS95_007466 [Cadophora gregata]
MVEVLGAGDSDNAGNLQDTSMHYLLPLTLASALLRSEQDVLATSDSTAVGGTEKANDDADKTILVTDLAHLGTSLQRSLPATLSGRLDFSAEKKVDLTDALYQSMRFRSPETAHKLDLKRRQKHVAKWWRIGLVDENEVAEIRLKQRSESLSSVSEVSIQLDQVKYIGHEDMDQPQRAPSLADEKGKQETPVCAGRSCWVRTLATEELTEEEKEATEKESEEEEQASGGHLVQHQWLMDLMSCGRPEDPSLDGSLPKGGMLIQSRRLLYRPLERGHTRVLRILPGELHESIRADLLRMRLGPNDGSNETGTAAQNFYAGGYDALSYCWGTSPATVFIALSGLDHAITPNLHSALRRLRSTTAPRYLWVDALCIDQEKDIEKGIQVTNMLSIYQSASSVVIWLAELNDTPQVGPSTMALLQALDRSLYRELLFERSHGPRCLALLHIAFDGLLALLARRWFRRTWVRQELAAAKSVSVKLGEHSLSWRSIKRATNRLYRLVRLLETAGKTVATNYPEHNLQYLKKSWRYGDAIMSAVCEPGSIYYFHGGGLLDLLMTGTIFEATNPRDRIHGILGLAKEPIEGGPTMADVSEETKTDRDSAPCPLFQIDYSKTVSAVFQHLAKYIINRDQNLDVLVLLPTYRHPEISADLPTWTPDWRVSPSEEALKACREALLTQVFASGCTRAVAQDLTSEGPLKVHAMLIDVLDKGMGIATFGYQHVHSDEKMQLQAVREEGVEMEREVWEGEAGNMLLVPGTAKKGDMVVLLFGARTLFVLRGSEKVAHVELADGHMVTAPCHELVGPEWGRELMRGEAFSKLSEKEGDERLEEVFLV